MPARERFSRPRGSDVARTWPERATLPRVPQVQGLYAGQPSALFRSTLVGRTRKSEPLYAWKQRCQFLGRTLNGPQREVRKPTADAGCQTNSNGETGRERIGKTPTAVDPLWKTHHHHFPQQEVFLYYFPMCSMSMWQLGPTSPFKILARGSAAKRRRHATPDGLDCNHPPLRAEKPSLHRLHGSLPVFNR